MNTKQLRIALMLLCLTMPIILWWTRTEDLPSMSAYANSPNNPFYHAMHVFGSWFFILQGAAMRRKLYYLVGFGMGAILFTNMYLVQTIHNIVTALTMGLAVACMIIYSKPKNLNYNIVMSASAIIVFILGFTRPEVHLFFAEWIAMLIIAIHMVKKVYVE